MKPPQSILTLAILIASFANSVHAADKPNILWLIGENIGPDLGCYGAKQVSTPNLDQLAIEGVRYSRAFATAPVCSTSRSAFMTGMYQTSIGAHHHRSHRTPGLDDHFHLPKGVRPITHWLIDAGYFNANIRTMDGRRIGTGKTDLNFEVDAGVLSAGEAFVGKEEVRLLHHDDANSDRLFQSTDWASLKDHQPFFAQVNFPNVERGVRLFNGKWTNNDTNPKIANPTQLELPAYYPDSDTVREDWAGYLDSVSGLDVQVGHVLKRLEDDGLADNTVVIFFGDNGRLEARGLDWCYDSGLHVPMIVRWPRNFSEPKSYQTATTNNQLLSLIDVTATTLAIAGISKPTSMQGRVFLGADTESKRDYVFGARDRTDDAVQRIRTVRNDKYRYMRNFMPEKPFLARHAYKDAHFPVYPVLREFLRQGKLTKAQRTLALPRLPDEELYDTVRDPYEVDNLADSKNLEHQKILQELRAVLNHWIQETDDQGRTPESPEVIDYWVKEAEQTHGSYLNQQPTLVP
jgi:arylsulfatase A-like enzyme